MMTKDDLLDLMVQVREKDVDVVTAVKILTKTEQLNIAFVSGSLFSDTVIDDEAWNKYPQNIYNDGEDSIFAEGARWMREKIKQELAKQ